MAHEKEDDVIYHGHLQRLRNIRRQNLFRLQEQAAQHGSIVPLGLANQIAEEEAALKAIDAVLRDPTPTSVLTELGSEGQTQIVLQELRLLRQARQHHDQDEREVRSSRQQDLDRLLRQVRYGLYIVSGLLLIIAVLLIVLVDRVHL